MRTPANLQQQQEQLSIKYVRLDHAAASSAAQQQARSWCDVRIGADCANCQRGQLNALNRNNNYNNNNNSNNGMPPNERPVPAKPSAQHFLASVSINSCQGGKLAADQESHCFKSFWQRSANDEMERAQKLSTPCQAAQANKTKKQLVAQLYNMCSGTRVSNAQGCTRQHKRVAYSMRNNKKIQQK